MLQELRTVGTMALQLPHVLRRRGCGSIQYVAGHLTICRDARLIRSLVPELIRTETLADPAAPAGAGPEPMAA